MPICNLPSDSNIEHLGNQAKLLLRQLRAGDPEAAALVAELHPRPPAPDAFRLSDAQLVVARRYGQPSWPKLKRHVETLNHHARSPHKAPIGGPVESDAERVDEFLRLACLTYGADGWERWERARAMLDADPALARANVYSAAAVGDVDAARELLERDPAAARRAGGPHDWEPLLYLAYSRVESTRPGHSTLDVARLLLAQGADPNAGFLWEGLSPPFTALTGALGYGEDAVNEPPHQHELELARLLLEAGADANDEQTLYNRNHIQGDAHLELLFAFGLGTGDGGPWHRLLGPAHATPAEMLQDQLIFAIGNDMPERVALLIAHGVDVDSRRGHPIYRGQSPYELAVANGSSRIVELLAAAGATPPQLEPVDELLSAAMAADRPRVDALLADRPELAAAAIARAPARILRAAELHRPEAVRLLAELGFDVSARDRLTALHQAAFDGDRELVDVLLGLGADPDALDTSFNARPSGWAEHNHHEALAAYLRERES